MFQNINTEIEQDDDNSKPIKEIIRSALTAKNILIIAVILSINDPYSLLPQNIKYASFDNKNINAAIGIVIINTVDIA